MKVTIGDMGECPFVHRQTRGRALHQEAFVLDVADG